jgi:hypothetical protein
LNHFNSWLILFIKTIFLPKNSGFHKWMLLISKIYDNNMFLLVF